MFILVSASLFFFSQKMVKYFLLNKQVHLPCFIFIYDPRNKQGIKNKSSSLWNYCLYSTSTLKHSLLAETNETLGSDRYAAVSMIQSLCEKSPREYTSDFVHTHDLVVIIILETITGKCWKVGAAVKNVNDLVSLLGY